MVQVEAVGVLARTCEGKLTEARRAGRGAVQQIKEKKEIPREKLDACLYTHEKEIEMDEMREIERWTRKGKNTRQVKRSNQGSVCACACTCMCMYITKFKVDF